MTGPKHGVKNCKLFDAVRRNSKKPVADNCKIEIKI